MRNLPKQGYSKLNSCSRDLERVWLHEKALPFMQTQVEKLSLEIDITAGQTVLRDNK